MAYVEFHASVPCGFLIRSDDIPEHNCAVTTDWDYPGVAMRMGWAPCCGATDGTVDCPEHGKSADDLIYEAYGWIRDHEGESFPDLADYLGHYKVS